MSEHVQIFAEGSFTKGDLTWGWQCFRCRVEETGFGSATTAGEGRDQHELEGCSPTEAATSEEGRCACPHGTESNLVCPVHIAPTEEPQA